MAARNANHVHLGEARRDKRLACQQKLTNDCEVQKATDSPFSASSRSRSCAGMYSVAALVERVSQHKRYKAERLAGERLCPCLHSTTLLPACTHLSVVPRAVSFRDPYPSTCPAPHLPEATYSRDICQMLAPSKDNNMIHNYSQMWRPLAGPSIYRPPQARSCHYRLSYADLDIHARRKNATRESTHTLKTWLQEHIKNPYPSKGEKIMLAIITKMTLTQVSTWFANARRRLKKESKVTWSARHAHEDDDDDDNDEESSKSWEDKTTDDKFTTTTTTNNNNNIATTSTNKKEEKQKVDCRHLATEANRPRASKVSCVLTAVSHHSNRVRTCELAQASVYVTEEHTPTGTDLNKPKIWSVRDFLSSTTNSYKQGSERGCSVVDYATPSLERIRNKISTHFKRKNRGSTTVVNRVPSLHTSSCYI